jgi:RNA polymerase sigma-70 factor (ECF subfamily)
MTEEELIKGLQNGDRDVTDRFIENYQNKIYRLAMGVLHNEQDAADLTQEVFIEIFRSVKKFRKESGVSTWVYRIAMNKSINHLRDHKKHRQSFSIDDEKIIDLYGQEDSASSRMHRKEVRKALRAGIKKLPEKQRKVFLLSRYQELTYKQIAEVTGYSLSSIESLLHRAKLNMQKFLNNFYKKNYL